MNLFFHFQNTNGYGSLTHTLDYKNGLMIYRTIPDEVFEIFIDEYPPKFNSSREIITFKTSRGGNLMIEEQKIITFLKYFTRYCKNWKNKYDYPIIDGGSWEIV